VSTRKTSRRRATTLVEFMVGIVILATLIGVIFSLSNMMSRQSRYTYGNLSQTQDAFFLLENMRLELQSMVMNPFEDARDHEGNSFVISEPTGSSIQFVTEKREGNERKRFLVYYEAKRRSSSAREEGLSFRKIVWRWKQESPWYTKVSFPSNPWPAEWVGPIVETDEGRFRGLRLQEIRWRFVAPLENEGRVFFRVKMVLKAIEGNRFLPFSTLVGVATPDLPTRIAACPCLFSSCFTFERPSCSCCLTGGGAGGGTGSGAGGGGN